ncbi:MAG: ATP-binding protein, partial [Planctomycetota bacterium]
RDITERKRFEKSLLASEEKYRTLFENAPLGIFRSTMEGRFIEVNPAIATLLRYDSPQEVIEHVRDIAAQIYVHPEERHQIIRALLNSNGVTRNTVHYRRRDGTVFIANLYLRLVRDEAGVPQLIEGMVEDITERKRAEEELLHAKAAAEAASRAKSYFLANMSHEIRTPMTAILGFTDVLLCDEHSPHKRREYLAIIRENGKVLLQLLNDVLDLSRIEARGIAIEPVPCNPRQVVEEVLALLRLRAEEKRLVLEANYQSPLPSTILTDAVRLRQVLVNLIGNGIKFTERGHVHVKVACSGRHSKSPFIHFTVSDTGIGIPPDVLSRLFQPFVQADDSFSRRYGGSGLGLAISKRLADALGGTLEVISCQGEGSTFTLSVPILAARQLEESLEPAEQLELGGRGGERATRVLLAEDVEAIRKFLCLVLRAGDVEVDEAVDGIAACKMAMSSLREQRPYDVILMDVQMPELDGLAATQRLRAQGWRWPIIALTAHAMEGDQERCLQAGCDSFLSKPVEREALLSAIAHWTEVARSASTGGN